jgi:hypothetical protein
MSEVFVFLLVVVVLLFIFGVAKNRDADHPSGLTLTKDLGDGIIGPAFFDSESGSSSHSHSAHCDHHHAPADTASHQGGFDASHFDAGGGHH